MTTTNGALHCATGLLVVGAVVEPTPCPDLVDVNKSCIDRLRLDPQTDRPDSRSIDEHTTAGQGVQLT